MSLSVIQRFHALVGSGRFHDALALFSEDAVIQFHGPSNNPLAGRHAGRCAIERFFGLVEVSFDVERFAADEFIDAGSTVVVLGRERSRVRATGRVFDVPWVQVWRVREGRIVELADYFDTGSMAVALAPSA